MQFCTWGGEAGIWLHPLARQLDSERAAGAAAFSSFSLFSPTGNTWSIYLIAAAEVLRPPPRAADRKKEEGGGVFLGHYDGRLCNCTYR